MENIDNNIVNQINESSGSFNWLKEFITLTASLKECIEYEKLGRLDEIIKKRQDLLGRLPGIIKSRMTNKEREQFISVLGKILQKENENYSAIKLKLNEISSVFGKMNKYKRSLRSRGAGTPRYVDVRK